MFVHAVGPHWRFALVHDGSYAMHLFTPGIWDGDGLPGF